MTGTKRLLILTFLTAALAPIAGAQTINAASCSSSDVLAAMNSVTADGTTVVIPACPSGVSWTSSQTFNQVYSMTVIGSSAPSGYNSQGSPTGFNDQTVFVDNINRSSSDSPMLEINVASGKSFRLSGITFDWGGGALTYNGTLTLYGTSQSVRFDHLHFNLINTVAVTMDGWMYGVWDHNQFDFPGSDNNGVRVGDGGWNNGSNGNSSWADSEHFGTNQWLFFENNTFNGSTPGGESGSNDAANDCNDGGRFVYRYNTLNNVFLQTHQMEGSGTDKEMRGCRAFEIYNNNWTGDNSAPDADTIFNPSGTGVIWGNSVASGFDNFVKLVNDRANGSLCGNCSQVPPPSGWGFCGTASGPSAWDGNLDSTGYPCIDGTSRGKGDLLTGTFPNKLDSVTGILGWPNQALIPIYEWLNTWTHPPCCNNGYWNADSPSTQNRDYYLYTASFTGASGTGSGLLSARPSTCTAGPGGNQNGVAYWATDTNTLYVCNPTNTWTTYYTPYTYPHPLTLGQNPGPSQSSGAPASPANLTATVH
jgi:hypothetical protein